MCVYNPRRRVHLSTLHRSKYAIKVVYIHMQAMDHRTVYTISGEHNEYKTKG